MGLMPPAPALGLTPARRLAAFERDAAGILRLLADADLAAPVPPCPGWTLADLVEHVGQVHQWARHAIVAGSPDGEQTAAPRDRQGLIDWYAQSAGALADTLRVTDPQAPAWHFGPRPESGRRTAEFWFRRQALEVLIHHWDAAAAQGSQGGVEAEVEPDLALDGIDEVVNLLYPRQVRLGRIPPLARSLALQPSEGRSWLLAGAGTEPEATVQGPAIAVLLLLWGRIDLDDDRLTLEGDEAAARAVLSAGIVP
jgi:uncharacterized protein (TIGR03083 family)